MSLSLDCTYSPQPAGDAASLYQKLQADKQAGKLGFCQLPHQEPDEIIRLAEAVRQECEALVVIGIGGSDLGARAVVRALRHQFFNLLDASRRGGPRIFFLGDTTDPVAFQEVLDVLDLARTTFVVISKSGNTVEQMASFVLVRQLLLDRLGAETSRQRLVVLTDREGGTLRQIVEREGYRSLPIPADVGGRYSVLSSVGLFPLAVAGLPVRQLLEGARSLDAHDAAGPESLPLTYARLQHAAYQEGRKISVLMPYAYALRELGFWFRQLWAESLGKQGSGPTPIAAVGPTDQHSQLQLYMEGPQDKIITFLTVEELGHDLVLPEAFPDLEGVRYLAGHSLAEILAAEQASTAYALAKAGRPSCRLSLARLDAYHIGQLLYFFELATAYMGELLGVNAFDQPGVESSKRYMYNLLGRPGFEEYRLEPPTSTRILSV